MWRLRVRKDLSLENGKINALELMTWIWKCWKFSRSLSCLPVNEINFPTTVMFTKPPPDKVNIISPSLTSPTRNLGGRGAENKMKFENIYKNQQHTKTSDDQRLTNFQIFNFSTLLNLFDGTSRHNIVLEFSRLSTMQYHFWAVKFMGLSGGQMEVIECCQLHTQLSD